MKVDSEDDVVLVRRKAREFAQARGFDPSPRGHHDRDVRTDAQRMGPRRRGVAHNRGGRGRRTRRNSRCVRRRRARHRGVDPVLAGGYSTAKSMGLGVSGSRRLVDEFSIGSAPGKGTVVTFVKWKRF